MDDADPFREISSTTRFLFWSRGGPVPAASPSKDDEAALRVIFGTPKGYKDRIEQSKIAMKGYSDDIREVNLDDEGKVTAAANYNNNQQGRRPTGERKRYQFTMKQPTSKALPVVDRSVLKTITDPDEYFEKEAELDEAEAEIRRLNGEILPKRTINFDPVPEQKRRNPLRPKKSYSFNISDSHTSSNTIQPAIQSENMKEYQMSKDDARASVYVENKQSVPSRSNKCAGSDRSVHKDSFTGKDKGDEITNIMASFQNFKGSNRLDFLRKSIGIGEIEMGKNYLRDSVLGDMAPRGMARMESKEVTLPGSHEALLSELSKHIFGDAPVGKHKDLLKDDGPKEVTLPGSHEALLSELSKYIFGDAPVDKHKDLLKDDGFKSPTLEDPLPGSQHARVSEFAERISDNAAMDKHTDVLKDDELSPDILLAEQSPVNNFSDVSLRSDEIFSASQKDREAPGSCAESAEHLDPEPKTPDRATIDDDPHNRHTISTEEGNVPVVYPVNDISNNEAEISSHHLEGASLEVLANTPGRDVAPGDIARTSHSSENNIQHQELVEEDGVVQDKSVHSLRMPLEDIGPQNQSQAPDKAIKKLRADLASTLSPINEKMQKAAQPGKPRQQPKRRKKVADESSHSLEMPQAESDNHRHPHDVNTEKSALSLTNKKTQKAGQRGKKNQHQKRGKRVADESHHSLEIPQSDFGSENQPHMHDLNTEQQTVVTRNALSPNKSNCQKEDQIRKRKRLQESNRRDSLGDAGLKWQSGGVRRSTRMRYRPLEHWRGERFVYGRIHNSLVTVIGVKTYSPGGDCESALKVKSLVPEQYSDIVAQSAKY